MPRRRVAQALAAIALFNVAFAGVVLWAQFPATSVDASMPDFLAFWSAARLALEGTPVLAWDAEAHRELQRQAMGLPFRVWLVWYYPPVSQLLVAPFGLVPYWPAMAAWILATAALYLAVCRRIVGSWIGVLAGLAAGPAFMNLINGQTGFLIAGLAGLFFLALPRAGPAGTVLALLSFKPQTALALPLLLAVAGRWRVLGWAAAGFALLVALSLALLGPATWAAFLESGETLAGVMQDTGRRYEMQATLYGFGRWLGLGTAPALALHAAVALPALTVTALAWRDRALSPALKAAMALYLSALFFPRLLNYDMTLLTVAGLFQVRHALRHGFFPGEKLLLGAMLLGLELSVFAQPGLFPAAAPLLLAACWLGHCQRSEGPSCVERG